MNQAIGLVLAIVAVVVLVGVGGASFRTASLGTPLVPAAEQDTRLIHGGSCVGGWNGAVHFVDDLTHDNAGTFITGATAGNKSETITVTGSFATCSESLVQSTITDYQYVVTLHFADGSTVEMPPCGDASALAGWGKDTGGCATSPSFTDAHLSGASHDPVQLHPWSFYLTTDSGGGLEGTIEVNLKAHYNGAGFSNTLALWAKDGAYLKYGGGTVSVPRADLFAEGDTIPMSVEAYAGNWTLVVSNGVGGPGCGTDGGFQTSSGDGLVLGGRADGCLSGAVHWSGERHGVVRFVVPHGVFRADGWNLWNVELHNTLLPYSQDDFMTIDNKAYAPGQPVVSNSPSPAVPQQTETLSFTSQSNAISGSPVDHFIVDVWYGSEDLPVTPTSPQWQAYHAIVPAHLATSSPSTLKGVDIGNPCDQKPTPPDCTSTSVHSYAGQYAFNVGRAEPLQWRVYAVDAAGRGTLSGRGGVETQGENTGAHYGPHAKDTTPGTSPALGLLVMLAALAGAFVAFRFVPAPLQARIGLAIGVAGLGLLASLHLTGVV